MTTEEDIIQILSEQVKGYRLLHDILKKEKICLVNINADEVAEISKEKDTVVMRLRLLEEERVRLVNKFTHDNEIPNTVNLRELAKLTGNSMFVSLRSQLLSLLQTIEELNRFNSILIDRSLNYFKTTTNFISTFAEESMTQDTGVLLSKET